jgi:hypothetical protein
MAMLPREPSFEFHRDWVQKIIATPSPRHQRTTEFHDSLTVDGSPTVHVLRGSKSFAARSFRSRTHANSVQFAPNKPNDENVAVFADASHEPPPPPPPAASSSNKPPVLGEIANNGQALRPGHWRLRTSPTPSIRKSKIEALVKHHGSPQHVRVTAGGRIVPSEQSPLCHPRFGYSAIKSNGILIKVAPTQVGKAPLQWITATQEGYVAQDSAGRLCQIVNGMILPLNQENGEVKLHIDAPNLNITQRGTSLGTHAAFEETMFQNVQQSGSMDAFNDAPQPTLATQKNALELEYSKLEQELKDLNKTEVLHGSNMASTAKEALYTKRRELTTSMDRVRKAIKSLNEYPQDKQVPRSPKAMRGRQSASPQQDRLPPFLQRTRQSNSVSAPPMQMPWQKPRPQHAFGLHVGGPFGMPNAMSTNAPFTALPYQMPPPGAFMQPPPFDGSMGAPFPMYQPPVVIAPSTATEPQPSTSNMVQPVDRIPQQDGSSSSDIKIASPRLSRALPIRDPETKQITNVKSVLNPMSPVYKPNSGARQAEASVDKPSHKSIDDRAPTPLAFMHSSKSAAKASSVVSNGSHASPDKTRMAIDSSSVSSVRTADFFPRNTRDYSIRKHEYPVPTDESSEDKENSAPEHYQHIHTGSQSPITPKRDLHNSNWNPDIPDGAFAKSASTPTGSYAAPTAPTAPPGTPVNALPNVEQKLAVPKFSGVDWDNQIQYINSAQMPDRVAHNLSPKNKRTWRFVEEHPSRYGSEDSSSPVRKHQCQDDVCTTASPYKYVDFSNKSRDWIEGYQAGLHRKPVSADRMGEFLDGYCDGLLKSQPITSVSIGISDGSPAKPVSRRPTPSPSQSSHQQVEHSSGSTLVANTPMELNLKGLDSFKQAVYAPQNESALMTPALDSPHTNKSSYHLGAWQKRHENVSGAAPQHPTFPQRASSLMERQINQSQQDDVRRDSTHDSNMPLLQKAAPIARDSQQQLGSRAPAMTPAQHRIASGPAAVGERPTSITSIDSALYRPWSGTGTGPRVISPFEWKSSSSVAHAANVATGFFAHAQFDGTAMDSDSDSNAMLTHAAGISGAPPRADNASSNVWEHRGASLDGMSSPTQPESPPTTSPNLSPTTSPRLGPSNIKHDADSTNKRSSPTKAPKSASPAKAKFEHIASKVGISVSSERRDPQDGNTGASPSSKKRWRDIWTGSSKKDGSKDDSVGGASPTH